MRLFGIRVKELPLILVTKFNKGFRQEKVYIESSLCLQRRLDAKKMREYFLANGLKIISKPKNADYLLLLTCAFRNFEKDLALKRIKKLKKYKGRLIVGGCLKGIDEIALSQVFNGQSFSTENINFIDEIFPDFKIKFKDLPDANSLYPFRLTMLIEVLKQNLILFKIGSLLFNFKKFIEERSLGIFVLRIGWGCIESHCSYCAIWRSVGKIKSKPVEECLDEFKKALNAGYKKILITADNPGAYGLDLNQTYPFLLNNLLRINKGYMLQLHALHPIWVIKYDKELEGIVKTGKIKIIECPIQSGSDRILKLMNRQHDAHQIRAALTNFKKQDTKLKLSTQIIIGFPSEGEKDFDDTLTLIKDIGFDHVIVFSYNKMPGINLERIGQSIPEEIIMKRYKKAEKFFIKHKINYLIDYKF